MNIGEGDQIGIALTLKKPSEHDTHGRGWIAPGTAADPLSASLWRYRYRHPGKGELLVGR